MYPAAVGAHAVEEVDVADGVVFPVGEEEQLILDDRSADLTAESVVVIARVEGIQSLGTLRLSNQRILRVQIAVLEILIHPTMETVRARLDRLVELPARGVSKLWRELVLQDRELVHRVVRESETADR